MKTTIQKITGLVFLSIISLVTFTSCTDDTPKDINDVVTTVSWKVTNFTEDGVDQTYHFSNYTFTFNDNGTLSATNGTNTYNGTWSKGTDDSTPKLILTFSVSSGPFEEISEDWEILNSTSSLIDLKHISGGDGSVDLLKFEKK
jgi:hypothetical protein